MICGNCGEESANVRMDSQGNEYCHSCGGFSEASGTRTSGLMTRNSQRIRSQSVKFEGDFLPPHLGQT